jgi:hypothetical protein
MGLTLTAGVVIDLATELLYTVVSGPSQHYATAVGLIRKGQSARSFESMRGKKETREQRCVFQSWSQVFPVVPGLQSS